MSLLDFLPPVLYCAVLPVSFMFFLERYAMHRLGKSPEAQEWVRSKFWLHPNFISRCRYPMGAVSLLMYHAGTSLYPEAPLNVWHYASMLFFGFWMITDITDGSIARHCDLGSVEGESIDPFSDKLFIFPPLFYFSVLGVIPLYLVVIFLFFDILGTISRFFIQNKAANLFGKAKMFLAVLTLVLITMQQMYYPEKDWDSLIAAALTVAVFLSFFSMFFKVIPNYWYANILSMLNLTCGICGIVLIVIFGGSGPFIELQETFPDFVQTMAPRHLDLAFALIFLGQFLDLFDGRAADKWGSTPKGELWDDVADGANFGGTIALLIWTVFGGSLVGVALGALHFSCTVFRLYRFTKDKRDAGVEGGVEIFSGLPSPAAALAVGAVVLLNVNPYVKVLYIIFISALMVSRMSYIHFGRVILPLIPKLVKVALLTFMLMIIGLSIKMSSTQLLYWIVFLSSLAYILFGIRLKKRISPR